MALLQARYPEPTPQATHGPGTEAQSLAWLEAVECDDLHDFVHQIQDAVIAQNARRIRELEAELVA